MVFKVNTIQMIFELFDELFDIQPFQHFKTVNSFHIRKKEAPSRKFNLLNQKRCAQKNNGNPICIRCLVWLIIVLIWFRKSSSIPAMANKSQKKKEKKTRSVWILFPLANILGFVSKRHIILLLNSSSSVTLYNACRNFKTFKTY